MSQVVSYHVLQGSWTTQTLNTSFKFLPTMTSGTNFSRVTGGQRIGAVLQPGDKNTSTYEWEIVFTSGESTRSVVTVQDIPFAGGIIQILNNFLIPPQPLVPTAESFNLANPPYAITSFLGALYSTNTSHKLQTYLNETSDITIFIPANIAFETVSNSLTSMSNKTLANLLSYHIHPGLFYSSDFTNDTTIQISGSSNRAASLRFFPNSYFINSARIIQSDILIQNGVIHVIDVVLDPEEKTKVPNPTSATQMALLPTGASGGFNASEAPFTTWLPNYVPTGTSTEMVSETETSTRTITPAVDVGYSTATATSSVKSGGKGLRVDGSMLGIVFGLFAALL